MFNTYRSPVTSIAGRRCQPTVKVKQLLVDAAGKEMRKRSRDIDEVQSDLFHAVNSSCPASSARRLYMAWTDAVDEFERTADEVRGYLADDEQAVHDRIMADKIEDFDRCRSYVNEYLASSSTKLLSPQSAGRVKAEARRLEDEIQDISHRLNQANLSLRTLGSRAGSCAGDDEEERSVLNIEPNHQSTPRCGSVHDSLINPTDSVSVVGSVSPRRDQKVRFTHPLQQSSPPPPSVPVRDFTVPPTGQVFTHPLQRSSVPFPGNYEPSTTRVRGGDEALHRLADLLDHRKDRLPQLEPEVFSGDMMQYPLWLQSFEALIEKNTSAVTDRLFFLGKYTAGPARECIAGFLSLFSADAYRRAKATLNARYGDKIRVAEAYKRKLHSWNPVKKGEGANLQKLADFLWQCQAAMISVGHLASLDTGEEISRIVSKLPQHLSDRWDRVVDRFYYHEDTDPLSFDVDVEGSYPPFRELCRFVSKEARVANGPGKFLSGESSESATKSSWSKATKKAQVLATDASEHREKKKPPECYYCEKTHVISKCDAFLKLDKETKQNFARANVLCFGCLSKRHAYKDCRHKRPEYLAEPKQGASKAINLATRAADGDDEQNYSLVVPVEVYRESDPSRVVRTLCMIDTQSTSCFVTSNLAETLESKIAAVDLHLTTMGNSCVVKSGIVDKLVVAGLGTEKAVSIKKCYTRESIPFEPNSIPKSEDLHRWEHLRRVADLFPEQDEAVTVDLLLGYNCPEVFVVSEYLYEREGLPYAANTGIGWGMMGSTSAPAIAVEKAMCHRTQVKEVSMAEVNAAFDLDLQSDAETRAKLSQDDKSFVAQVADSMKLRDDGHYETALPFRTPFPVFSDNREMSYRRLMSLKKRMLRDPVYAKQYRDFMENLFENGFAEKVTSRPTDGRCSYSPHHGVTHPRKPGKVRVVSNFSAEQQGVSLNQQLLAGPDMTSNLVGVVCRFREERVAFLCDIKGMFLQVFVAEPYRDYLRFLWFADGDPEKEVEDCRMCVHPFGATSSPSVTSSVLKATADAHVEEFDAEVINFIKRSFYVDDGLGTKPTVEQVVALFLQAHELCKRGGFYLHKFVCNDARALTLVPKELIAESLQGWENSGLDLPVEASLGLLWEMATDCFIFVIRQLLQLSTRRGFLSALSSIYDPLGFISPVILIGRLILKELCAAAVSWDEPVPEEFLDQWTRWYQSLAQLKPLKIQRCYRSSTEGEYATVQLHHFCDASVRGFGVCSYIRLVDLAGNIDVALVSAKARVSPKKVVTIPRLELQAAVLATKAGKFLDDELPYPQIEHWFWSDSMVALGYITNVSKKFHLFVANRVQYVREHSVVDHWLHIPGVENPADIASRGSEPDELLNSEMWWKGPVRLQQADWRQAEQASEFQVPEDDPEIKVAKVVTCHVTVKKGPTVCSQLERISSWRRAVAVVTVWITYVRKLRDRVRILPALPIEKGSGVVFFSVATRKAAERLMVRYAQAEEFSDEIRVLRAAELAEENRHEPRAGRRMLKQNSTIYQLDLFLDKQDIVRIGGRLENADLSFEMRHPVLLPKKSHVTCLIVVDCHERAGHPGRQGTLAAVRNAGYWPVHGRSAVEACTRDCVLCRKIRALPVVQKMADLPEVRLTESAPFTYCGVDLCGPFTIRERRSDRKKWICVFVCFVSKAVHLEITPELSTDCFLNAFRRFVARRGPVRSLYCDRGTNFVGAANEYEHALLKLDQDVIHGQLLKSSCDWTSFTFNPPKASHMGGLWERMIRSFRSTFAGLLTAHKQQINEEVLSTLVVETEGLMNSRPLTVLDLSDPTADPPLTPARLLTMKTMTALPPPGEFPSQDIYSHKRWRRIQYLVDQFWRQWRREVLPTLQARQKWNVALSNLKKDDVVLVMDEQVPRGKWPLAIIDEAIPSADGLVRKVRLRTADSTYERPVCKLVYLCSTER